MATIAGPPTAIVTYVLMYLAFAAAESAGLVALLCEHAVDGRTTNP